MGFEQGAQQIELTVRGMTCDACALHVARALQGVAGVLHGDASLFTRGDRAELAWRLLDLILSTWQARKAPLATHDSGSWGPLKRTSCWRATVGHGGTAAPMRRADGASQAGRPRMIGA